MSVKVVRIKNGEDIICDLYEVSTRDAPDKPIGYQLKNPFSITLIEEPDLFQVGDDDEENSEEDIIEIQPDIDMRPWAPLSSTKDLLLKTEDVLTAYDTFPEIIEKYTELVEKANGRFTGEVDPTKGPPGISDREPDTTG